MCPAIDVSNACLGLLSGLLTIADQIELGRIRAGIVVGTETGRDLVESTVEWLATDPNVTRKDVKRAFASLTIGSGSAAMLIWATDSRADFASRRAKTTLRSPRIKASAWPIRVRGATSASMPSGWTGHS